MKPQMDAVERSGASRDPIAVGATFGSPGPSGGRPEGGPCNFEPNREEIPRLQHRYLDGRRLSAFICGMHFSLFLCGSAFAQKPFEFGGFLEASGRLFARRPNPPDAYATGASHFRLWSHATLSRCISWRGQVDFRIDTHRNVDRGRWADFNGRGLRQPAGEISEFYLDMKLGRVDLRAGKQVIRWGRADGFNPTDNIIPFDYLDTLTDERLAVPALKADAYLGKARFETVWIPFYTPTRLPLLGQRWFPGLPATAQIATVPGNNPSTVDLSYRDVAGTFPARTFANGQWGVRWNQMIPRAEFSISYFDGFDDLAYFRTSANPIAVDPQPGFLVSLRREYYRVHVIGADFASQFGPFGVRGEMAYFDQTDPANLDHLLFVIGLDRTWGDWFAIIQYAGQKVTGSVPTTAVFPDLGLRSSLICRIERTLGPASSIEVKGALRLLDGDLFVQPLYSIALANKWRLKLGGTLFAGPKDSYLGQFRDNSHLLLQLRYSF
jgi:hypothetical protein